MSIFTEKDFKMVAQGYLLKDILKDHIENYEEVYKFYNAFVKDWNNSVDSRITLLKGLNNIYGASGTNPSSFFLYSGNNIRIQVFLKKSINNLPQIELRFDTTPEEDIKNTYPDADQKVHRTIYEFYESTTFQWASFVDAWNSSIMSTNDRVYLEAPLLGIPKSNLTLSFPKKYLIGEYDD